MYTPTASRKCRTIRKITVSGIFYCLRPGTVLLGIETSLSEPLVLCLDCARELAKEIVDSVPGGRLDKRVSK